MFDDLTKKPQKKKRKKTEIDANEINIFEEIAEPVKEERLEKAAEVKDVASEGLLITPSRLIILSISLYLFFIVVIGIGIYYYVSNIRHSTKKIDVRPAIPSQIIKPEDIPPPLEIGTFFVPFRRQEGEESFLKLSVSVWGKGEGLNVEIHDKIVLIRENIYSFLNKKEIEGLNSDQIKNILSKELFDIINRSLKDNHIDKLFFTEFFIM